MHKHPSSINSIKNIDRELNLNSNFILVLSDRSTMLNYWVSIICLLLPLMIITPVLNMIIKDIRLDNCWFNIVLTLCIYIPILLILFLIFKLIVRPIKITNNSEMLYLTYIFPNYSQKINKRKCNISLRNGFLGAKELVIQKHRWLPAKSINIENYQIEKQQM
jgi:uncharacterized membrane protein YhaH (DUF805 family)